jgi:hypothetical protein
MLFRDARAPGGVEQGATLTVRRSGPTRLKSINTEVRKAVRPSEVSQEPCLGIGSLLCERRNAYLSCELGNQRPQPWNPRTHVSDLHESPPRETRQTNGKRTNHLSNSDNCF